MSLLFEGNLFESKTVIVTGGTKGIGRGIADFYLQQGAKVIVCSRSEAKSEFENLADGLLFFQADVRDAEQSQALIDFAVEQTGRLDILVNNAGGSPEVDAGKVSPRFTQAIIDLNLVAPAVICQQAYHAMIASNKIEGFSASIINIASVSAMRPSPGTAAYGAAKAGLVNLTKSLAQEWAPDIRVNVIIAGLAKTEAAIDHYGGEQGIKNIEQRMPMQRMATPNDIAKACVYLSSPAAAYVSGATLEVHGGGEPPAFLSIKGVD